MREFIDRISNRILYTLHSLKAPRFVVQCYLNWRWIALSAFIGLIVAVFYILRTEPQYVRQATLLIKNDSKSGKSAMGELAGFTDMGFFNSSTNVDNEVVSVKSPSLMLEVVKRLNLDITYRRPGTFHNPLLYGKNLPISVFLPDVTDNSRITFDVELNNGNIEISNIKGAIEGREVDDVKTYKSKLSQPILTSVGKITINPSPYYNPKTSGTIHVNKMTLDGAVNAFSAGLTASVNGKYTTIIDMSYQDVSTQRAEDILNTLILVYNESWVKDKNQVAISTSQFINDRLQVIEKELGNVDSDISSFKSANRIPDLAQTSSLSIAKADATSTEITNLSNQLYITKYIRNYITTNGNNNQLLPVNVGVQDAGIESQIKDYNIAQLQRNNLVANSSVRNPLVVDLDSKLASMRSAIVVSLDNQLKVLDTKMQTLRKTEQTTDAKISSNPEQAQYLLSIERQQKVKEALYLFLLQKREENELSQAFTAYNTRIITPPMGSSVPVAPKRSVILLAGLLVGLALPIGWIYLLETTNTKVRGRKDIEELSIPFLGELPIYIGKEKQKKRSQIRKILKHSNRANDEYSIVVKEKSKNFINEAFRVVRTNLEFMNVNGSEHQIIMYTSANPASGKTFISMNTGVSFAIKNRKTIVVDLDLRRASLSSYVNNPIEGLSSYLTSRIDDWHKIVVKHECNENLSVIPVGVLPPNPAELLFSTRLEKLLSELKQEYELVILDCPPIDLVADTSVIAKFVDTTVFVIRVGLLDKEMLKIIEDYHKERKFPNMAIILNGTTTASNSYGYGYGYGGYAEEE